MTKVGRIQTDEFTKLLIFSLIVCQLLLDNGLYLLACYMIALFLFIRLSQPYKPGVFTVIAFNHILQIVASVWLANYLDEDINYRSPDSGLAVSLSLIGLVFLLAPVISEQDKIKSLSLKEFRMQAFRLSTQKSLNCYIVALFVSSSLTGIAFLFSGLTQIIVSLIKIKWFFFLLFGYQAVLKKERMTIFYVLVFFEFLTGFYSFFSDFKTVIYYLGVLLISFVANINIKQLTIGIILIVGLTYMSLLWTSIKSEYRSFLNKGSKSQTVQVSQDEAIDKLVLLSQERNRRGTLDATKDLLDRLQYTFHFAKTLEMVPERIPFQNGANWLTNIEFATTPRFLNPNKPTIDNSVKASRYTGIRYAKAAQGVSFSLGYFAEFYIDFGQYLMMPMLYLLGFIYSRIYRYFQKTTDNPIINYAIVGAFFFEFNAFEMDGTYFSGRFLASIVTFFALSFLFAKPILQYVTAKKDDSPPVNKEKFK